MIQYLKRLFTSAGIMIWCGASIAQGNSEQIFYINVVENNPVDYHMTDIADFDRVLVFENAFTVRAWLRNMDYLVSARLEQPPSGQMIPDGLFSVRLSDTNSGVTTNLQIPLRENTDVVLFQQSDMGNRDYNYTYDFLIGPISRNMPPGEYGATVIVTLTLD
ncbi:hypothetical protein KZP23_02930 [Echinicola marina]|uniref:hypothetical protein n=1 Tax=Echinicola marina TaxID=2859768 RepID=UPI001CF665A6|nr:hypothetical protein [Echinicola marina]UCS94002.1 hypothetical protein KZP23_02930 [Echinicola marina]